MIQQIIVSGQTIAETDVLGVAVAKGIEPGGWALRGWPREIAKTTSYAPAEWLGDLGLKQCSATGGFKYRSQDAYRRNIADADVTILFHYAPSANVPGSVQQFIIEECTRQRKILLSILPQGNRHDERYVFLYKNGKTSMQASDEKEFAALVLSFDPKIVHIVAPRLLVDPDAGHVAGETIGRLLDNLKALEAENTKARDLQSLEVSLAFLGSESPDVPLLRSFMADHPAFAEDLIEAYVQWRIKDFAETSVLIDQRLAETHPDIWGALNSKSVCSIQEPSL